MKTLYPPSVTETSSHPMTMEQALRLRSLIAQIDPESLSAYQWAIDRNPQTLDVVETH